MLKQLEYSVTFASTGRTLEQNLSFEKGLGAITGPNEIGKSFVLEMIRFMLFGSGALRGSMTDYKRMKASLILTIKGEEYTISRTTTNARIRRGDEDIAVGTRPVNEKIVEILGFGLDVFDIACAANQGEMEKLGSMTPSERKRMIDNVIGLSVIDDLTKWCSDEISACTKAIATIEPSIVEPTAPEMPAGYEPSANLKFHVDAMEALERELHHINGKLAVEMEAPVQPAETIPDFPTLEQVQEHRAIRAKRAHLQAEIDKLPIVDVVAARRQNEAAARWKERQRLEKLTPYSREGLEAWKRDWGLIELHYQYQKKEAELAKLMARLTTCPECGHQWGDHEKEICQLQAQMKVPPEPEPETPPLQLPQIIMLLGQWEAFDAEAYARVKDAQPAEPSKYTETQLARFETRDDLISQLEQIPHVDDLDPLWEAKHNLERAWAIYEAQVPKYVDWLDQRDVLIKRQKELKATVVRLPALRDRYQAAAAYEVQLGVYSKAVAAYLERKAGLDQLKQQAEDWKKARLALTNLRTLVKQHLIPSLNRVASHLLQQMTGGQRQTVAIDEDFDVQVDGQPLHTLSGSGKAVANLSIRLGLGQVLTNNVLSLFMGDEMDASMDDDRAKNLTITLDNLKDRISQILLVTHKYPVADYYMALGRSEDEEVD